MPIVKRKTASKIRKTHRYLGIFIGIQFIMWTVSGLYFSWTDINEIRGDHFRNSEIVPTSFSGLKSPSELNTDTKVHSVELKEIAGEPYYWINHSRLHNAKTGEIKTEITQEEALAVADRHMIDGLEVKGVERITSTGKHHEYRSGPLPAYVISYDTPENIRAYIHVKNGDFKSVRHRDWRWFDFLWMTHTMDYEGRDDFNTTLLRGFSLLGLITVFSGFLLWFISSPTMIKWFGKKKKKKKKKISFS